ncbi:zinc finger MYM-type protein 1-like, partial [Dysidea avara]|uniref:zinc finger MYM-type protein 1-like n=1 Tax=Dysidea avara TaxID=196820 RepID=UPI003320320C
MAKRVLSEISFNIQQSTFYSLMADETTDVGNKEQLVVVYRWIDDEFAVHEDFVGLHVGAPSLPRRRKRPVRYEPGNAAAEFATDPEDHYKRIYYEALDLIIVSITDCFDQPRYALYSNLEQLLLKAVKHEDYEELKSVSGLYQADLHTEDLKAQLLALPSQISNPNFSDILNYLQRLDKPARSLYCEVVTIVRLLLVMPASNATSERLFSALRRIKTYLRTTMTQERLNNSTLLH